MWFLPSRAQWASWSLPSKLTAIGTYAGIIGVLLTIVLFAISTRTQGHADKRPDRPADTVPPQPAAANGESAAELLDLDALLVDLNQEGLTKLQREQMRESLRGRKARWRVLVRDVTKLHGDDVLLLFISPSQESEFSPDILAATFPAHRVGSLSALRPGDSAVIEGSLGFTQWGLSQWLPELDDSELLSFSTASPAPSHGGNR